MVFHPRFYPALVSLALIIMILATGCTSSGEAGGSTAGDSSGYHSSFAGLAGTYVNVDDPASSIVLDTTGFARIVAGSSVVETSIFMEEGVLMLADRTSIGPYPIQDDALIYQGVKYRKQS